MKKKMSFLSIIKYITEFIVAVIALLTSLLQSDLIFRIVLVCIAIGLIRWIIRIVLYFSDDESSINFLIPIIIILILICSTLYTVLTDTPRLMRIKLHNVIPRELTKLTLDTKLDPVWGPERPIFVDEKRPTFVSLNSVTNNPYLGDERDFLRCFEAGGVNIEGNNIIKLDPGIMYSLRIYFQNNAISDDKDTGIAKGVMVKLSVPDVIRGRRKSHVTAYIKSDNAIPKQIYDGVVFVNDKDYPMTIKIFPKSVKIFSQGSTNGKSIDYEQLINNGVLIGSEALDGTLPPGDLSAGFISLDFKIEKSTIRSYLYGRNENAPEKSESWERHQIHTKEEEVVDICLFYNNTGNTDQEDVTIKVCVPEPFSLVPDSFCIKSQETGNEWTDINDVDIDSGINIGAYKPGDSAYFMFKVAVKTPTKFAPPYKQRIDVWIFTKKVNSRSSINIFVN